MAAAQRRWRIGVARRILPHRRTRPRAPGTTVAPGETSPMRPSVGRALPGSRARASGGGVLLALPALPALLALLALLTLLAPPAAAGAQLPPGLLERAEGGDAVAQNEVGSRYYAGRGVARDDAEAARWIRTAAEQGYAPAQYNLGLLHFRNRGVPGTDAEAARWYGAAARQGYAPAQAGLGYLHIYGAGVERNPVLAYMWLELAFRGAADEVTRRLYAQRRDELGDRMPPDDTREGRRLADGWRPDDNP